MPNMPKLPILSGKQLIKALLKHGYSITRQKGSHVRLYPQNNNLQRPITIPLHKIIKPGLLHQILKDANLTPDELILLA
jgi:predicted RNA binding protein YcfA (HicA-like mRNA interferase family)